MNFTQIPDLSTRQLQAIIAVAENRSFIAAAAYLRTSQPALSRTVRRVEDVLGVVLFDRTTRSVSVTSAGQEFIAVAERVINDLKISARSMRELADEQRGQVILSCIMSVATGALVEIIRSYRESRPGVEIHIREGVHGNVLEDVRSGVADFGITYIDDLPEGIASQSLGWETFHIVLPVGHRLAERTSISLDELSEETLVSLPLNSQSRRIVDSAVAVEGFEMRNSVTVTQSATMMNFVRGGVGFAIVPEGAASGFNAEGIILKPIRRPKIKKQLGTVNLFDRSFVPTAAGLLGEIKEHWIKHGVKN